MGHTLLEKIVEEHVGQTLVGTVNVAVDKLAEEIAREEIAREALADETFRRALREFVRLRSQELLDELLRNGAARNRRSTGAKRLRKRR